jgi:glycosyltransferase involved in cell wall biosynthesis
MESDRILFLNLRGDQSENVAFSAKAMRILRYYASLIRFAWATRTPVFHIVWNNKYELLDRTLLMLYYRALRKRVLLTAHNVNSAKRDKHDSWLNRWSLRTQYRLCNHIFVHTELMKRELMDDFFVSSERVSVIPFGINNMVPTTALTRSGARAALGLPERYRILLFFGQIAPYKGLEYLVSALPLVSDPHDMLRVVVAGKIKKGHESYWTQVSAAMAASPCQHKFLQHITFVPDEQIEVYFKAADAVVMPYTDIFQSGVAFLAFSFGVPVIATDVGSLREDVIEGKTGLLCASRDPAALATAIESYFRSGMYRDLDRQRTVIRGFAAEHHSWKTVAAMTKRAYESQPSAVGRRAG